MKGYLMKSLPLQSIISQILTSLNRPVITDYQLGRIIYVLYSEKKYKNYAVRIRKDSPERKDYHRYLEKLLEMGILSTNKAFPSNRVFDILNPHNFSDQEIICSVDPFSYISHFSAMEYHGLTDKILKTIFYTTLTINEWRQFSYEKMTKEIKELDNYNLPRMVILKPEKFGKNNVHCNRTKRAGGYQIVADSPLRVTKIGQTFLDMLQKPELCGGIYHVIEVFREYAERYFNLILPVIDKHGKVIDKMRAGYILEEQCNIKNSQIDQWQKFAQRGGSRKLDPTQEYSHVYSEKWCLSINIEI